MSTSIVPEPLISIIVPVFNTEDYIEECIDSVLAQTDGSWELILVDDGSTDNSGNICDEYALTEPRIKVIHKPNSGPIESRLIGISAARGTYCSGLDSDDYVDKDYVEKIKQVSDRGSYDIIAWNMRCIADERVTNESFGPRYGVYSNQDYLLQVVKLSNHSVCNKAIKTELIKSVDYSSVPKHIHDGEDYMITVPPICMANSVYWMEDTMYNYRQLQNSMANHLTPNRIIEYFESSTTVRKYIAEYGMLTDELVYYDDLIVMELVSVVIKYIYKEGTINRFDIKRIRQHPFYREMRKNERIKNLTMDQFFILKLFRCRMYHLLSIYYSICVK